MENELAMVISSSLEVDGAEPAFRRKILDMIGYYMFMAGS